MNLEYLEYLLSLWARWMRHDDLGLGYPKRSLGMSSGGASTEDSFDELFEGSEREKVRSLDTIINSLEEGQKKSIYHVYLGSKPPSLQDYKFQLAMDNLLTLATKRIDL